MLFSVNRVKRLQSGGFRMVKTSKTGSVQIEFVDNNTVRTIITRQDSMSIRDKQRVFGKLVYFTPISEKEDARSRVSKVLYYKLNRNEMILDDYRLMDRVTEDEDIQARNIMISGLVQLFLLISEGKVYDVEINPLNFVYDKNNSRISAFYRKDRALAEITDKWLNDVKKLLTYFLVLDSGVVAEDFENLTVEELLDALPESISNKFRKLLDSNSISDMAKICLSDSEFRRLLNFPPIFEEAYKPKDVTTASRMVPVDYTDMRNQRDSAKEKKAKKPKNRYVGNTGFKNKAIIGASVCLSLVVGLVGGKVLFGGGNVDLSQPVYDKNIQSGLMNASIQKYDEASSNFDEYLKEDKKQELDEDLKLSMYFSYLLNDEYDKALDVDPGGAEGVVSYLKAKKKINEVSDIKADLPAINFEKAVLDQDYEQIVKLKDKVKDTEDRQTSVVEALVKTDNLDAALKYVKAKNITGLKKAIEDWSNETIEKGSGTKEQKKNLKEDADKKIKSELDN